MSPGATNEVPPIPLTTLHRRGRDPRGGLGLVSIVFSRVSHRIALLVRREATMIAASNFVGLPLMFLSSILITQRVMPHWMQEVSRFNP